MHSCQETISSRRGIFLGIEPRVGEKFIENFKILRANCILYDVHGHHCRAACTVFAVAAEFNTPSMTALASGKICVAIASNSSCMSVLGLLFMPQCSIGCTSYHSCHWADALKLSFSSSGLARPEQPHCDCHRVPGACAVSPAGWHHPECLCHV